MTTIPLIDLDRWFERRRRRARRTRRRRRRPPPTARVPAGRRTTASRRHVIDDCREQSRPFFHLPAEREGGDRHSRRGAYRGWVGPGLESNAATYGIDTPPDLKETFAYGPVDVPDDVAPAPRSPVTFAPNRWPSEPAGFQTAAEAWWRAGAAARRRTARPVLARARPAPGPTLRDRCRATTAQVSLNWYGPRGRRDPEPEPVPGRARTPTSAR